MNCMIKWLAVLIILSLAKIDISATASVATEPAQPIDEEKKIIELIQDIYGHNVLDRMTDIVDNDNIGKAYNDFKLILKETGKDNELWLDYLLLAEAVKSSKYDLAGTFLDTILESPIKEAVLERIRGGSSKEYQSVLNMLYLKTVKKNYKNGKLERYEAFKNKLIGNVYSGTNRASYDEAQSLTQRTQFTDEELKLAATSARFDHLKIMLKQVKKSNLSKNALKETFYRQNLYFQTWNTSVLKMLIDEKVPMIAKDVAYFRSARYCQTDQKLRAANLDLIKIHDFGDDLAHANKLIPDFEYVKIYTVIKDKNLNKYLSLFFMNRKIGHYKSEWIIDAIKYANMEVLKVLLEERVPLPDAQELADAIANRKEIAKTVQDYNDFIDSYRRFYDPETRFCIEGPKYCKKKIKKSEDDYYVESDVEIEDVIPESRFIAYNRSGGSVTATASFKSECAPFGPDYGDEIVSIQPVEQEH